MFKQDVAELPLFKGLSLPQLELLATLVYPMEWKAGETIFYQGDPALHLYILMRGEVALDFKTYDGVLIGIGQILPGGVFGWSAALGRDCYTANATAVRDITALRLLGTDLHILCEEHPETGIILLDHLADLIAEKANATHDQVFELLCQGVDIRDPNGKKEAVDGRGDP
jgi:CRP-like cAMP-binding protein